MAFSRRGGYISYGQAKKKVVPLPGVLLTVMFPLWSSIILLLMASPSPLPISFVVKNGLNIFVENLFPGCLIRYR